MKKSNYNVLGAMSGTSLDGIDLAHCFISVSEEGSWGFKIGVSETIPYPPDWKTRLQEAIHFSEGRLQTLNKEYTIFLGQLIAAFIQRHQLEDLDAVCSHGHTILHQPDKGVTLQIGNLAEIAGITGQRVVCDFRTQDVALGGQGAPLVPIGDQLLFGNYDYCLNLGGFANCSFEKNGRRIAYDICPVNIVLNHYAEQLGHAYDAEGAIAASGHLDSELLDALNALSYYSEPPPKTLGLEWVQQQIFPLLQASNTSVENKLHTFTEHVAQQLARQFRNGSPVLVTGGGTYNAYLLNRLRHYSDVTLEIPNAILLEFKEALVFGLLGVLRLRGEVNCLASVTGASRDHCGGVVFAE
jgi:anhydro-N-acetylmuramic acid kinase